jgi:hypothetical protein
MRIYHAQNAYRAAHGAWAASLDALGLPRETPSAGMSRATLRLLGAGDYEAAITIEAGDARPRQTWTVRPDSRLVRTPE